MKWRSVSPEQMLRKEGVGRNRQVLPQEKEGEVRRDNTLNKKQFMDVSIHRMITLIV